MITDNSQLAINNRETFLERLPENILESSLSDNTKLVLATLDYYAARDKNQNKPYSCFISNAELAQNCGITSAGVTCIVSNLVKFGLITRERGKRHNASVYTLNQSAIAEFKSKVKLSKVSLELSKVDLELSKNLELSKVTYPNVEQLNLTDIQQEINELRQRLDMLQTVLLSKVELSKVNELTTETETDTESKNIKGPSMRVNTCRVMSHDSVLTIEKNSTDVTAHVDTDENDPCKIDINSNSDSDKGTSTTISTDNAHNDNSNISAETIESLHRDPCKINSISDVPQGDTTTFSTNNAQNNDDMKNKFNLISDEITGKEDTQSKVEGLIKTPSPHAAARPADRIKSLTIDNALNELNTIKREWDGYTDEKRLEKSQRVTDIDTAFRGHLRSHWLTPLQAADVLRLTDELRKLSNSCDFSFVFADPVTVDTDDDNSFIPDVENEQTDEDENATEADKIKSFVPVTIPKLKALNYKTRITDEQADEFEKWGERFNEIVRHIPLKQQNEFADLYNTVAERFDIAPLAI